MKTIREQQNIVFHTHCSPPVISRAVSLQTNFHSLFYSDIKFNSRFLYMCSVFEFTLKENCYFCFDSIFIAKTHLTEPYSLLAHQKHPLPTVC